MAQRGELKERYRYWMAGQRLGVGFVGGGFVGQFHIRSFVGVRNSDVLGVVGGDDDTAEEASALARKLGVGEAKPYASVTEMVEDPAIDALWICAPNFTRVEIMEEIAHAVESGRGELIGVACEKPLGRNTAEARKMLELVQKVGLGRRRSTPVPICPGSGRGSFRGVVS